MIIYDDRIMRLSHKIKGLALNMRFPLLAELVGNIEKEAANKNYDRVKQIFEEAVIEWDLILSILE